MNDFLLTLLVYLSLKLVLKLSLILVLFICQYTWHLASSNKFNDTFNWTHLFNCTFELVVPIRMKILMGRIQVNYVGMLSF